MKSGTGHFQSFPTGIGALYFTVLAIYDFHVQAVLCIYNQINLWWLSFFSLTLPHSLPNANNTVLTVFFFVLYSIIVLFLSI